jgi:putative Mn2+ efflux pump MntP
MSIFEICLAAIGLSMDAFAISVCLGLSCERRGTNAGVREMLLAGIYFGASQAIMPALGFLLGSLFARIMEEYSGWVAFVLLAIVGGKMLKDSFSKEDTRLKPNPFRWTNMLVLAIADSIDAFAVGVTYAALKVEIISACLITGAFTFVISAAGVKIGAIAGERYKSRAEIAGGAVLILLGIKALVEQYV